MNTIAAHLNQTLQTIRDIELRYNRPPNTIRLLAVSKGQTIDAIQAAYAAGQRAFGENYLQEALPKIAALTNPDIEWHFIGPIQSNKTKKIAEHFDWVQSISDFKTAQRLNDQRPAHLPPLNICIQVNISNEETKSGISASETRGLATSCLTLPRLKLRGLMAIPAEKKSLADQCVECKKLYSLYQKLCQNDFDLDTLSIGMSNDMVAAIAEGSTMVRIGTNIFGERK